MTSKIILILLLNLTFNILSSQSVKDNDFPEHIECLENRIDKIFNEFLKNLTPEKVCTAAAIEYAVDEVNNAKSLMRENMARMNRYLRLEFPISHRPLTCTQLLTIVRFIGNKYMPGPDIDIYAIEQYLRLRLSKNNC